MRYQTILKSSILGMLFFGCSQFQKKPSLAFVSPHLELDSYDFKQAADGYQKVMKTDLYGVSATGNVPVFSVEELSKHDLVIFESMGARISLIKPQIDSIKAKTKVLFLQTPLAEGNVNEKEYPEIKTYWNNASRQNYKGLLSYIAAKVFKLDVAVEKPVRYPESGFYHPEVDSLFHSAAAYLKWYNQRHPLKDSAQQPVIGIAFYQSNYVKHDLRHIDALIKSIEAHGARPVALMQKSGFKLDSMLMINGKPIVDVVLYGGMFLNFSHPEKGRKAAETLDVPLLSAVTHYYKNPAEWEKDPGGFAPDLTDRFFFSERDGVTEPMIIGADETQPDQQRYIVPIAHQINWRVERAIAWAKLRHTPNSQKRIVSTYYSEGNGKANVGADIDSYLDVPASLVKLLKSWKEKGYDIGKKPLPDAAELARQMSVHASNVGTWAPEELKKRMTNGEVITIPEKEYLRWFSSYPAAQQKQVIQKWGLPPGKLMVTTDQSGQKSIVIPIIRYGKIILAPHPNWGLQDNPALIYGKNEIPPNHEYIAFYEWMKRVEQPHAFLSLFTQLSLMPGKMEGPSSKDFNGELIGNIPHINMVPLIANGGVANKRRASATTIGYLTEITQAGLSDSLKVLNDKIQDWETATNPALKNKLQSKVLLMIGQLHIEQELVHTKSQQTNPQVLLIRQTQAYLLKIAKQHMPDGGHILGSSPTGETLVEMVTGMLGKEFEQALPGAPKNRSLLARNVIRSLLTGKQTVSQIEKSLFVKPDSVFSSQLEKARMYQRNLAASGNEITQILSAMDGKYLSTGPSDDAIRNPESIPSGRNPYGVNVKNIPAQEAWDLGKRMADQLLLQFENKHGKGAYPKKVGFVLWSSEVVQSQGVTEAEILNLIGVKPVWNSKGQIMDVELISAKRLARPRIDVLITTSGTYRDHFSGNIKLLDKAIKLAAAADEPDNWVRKHSLTYQKKLHIDSLKMASLRVFSSNEGAYSTNLEFAAEHGESWSKDTTLSNLYLKRMAHAYGENVSAYYQRSLFELNIKDIDAAAFSRSSNVYGIMDHPMVAAYFGAYNLVVKNITGHQPDMFINDMQDSANPEVTPLTTFFHQELRSRYLNPKWIKGMMAHGYDGARYMDSFTENFFLWDVTTPDMVKDQDWNDVYDTYVKDKYKLNVSEYLDKANPYAKQSMIASMLEANEKGYWKASAEQQETMAKEVANSVVKNGPACNTAVCNSPSLAGYIKQIINRTPGNKELAAKYTKRLSEIKSSGKSPSSALGSQQLSGKQMTSEQLVSSSSAPVQKSGFVILLLISILTAGLFGLGWFRK